jgi:ribonuclease HII
MTVLGIDEVGRGCWAGPLVAGAVALGSPIEGLADSKVLSKKRREVLASAIHARALAIGLGWVAASEVDALGLTASVRLAMERALAQITSEFDEIIIDGSYNFLASEPRARAVVKADASVPAVSAASITAKVARDTWMSSVAEAQFPQYGFARHVGYGTAEHLAALEKHGASELHRASFRPVAKILALAAKDSLA